MKKMKHFAYAGAIALLSVVGFTACSSSDGVAEVVEPSPNYNPETNEVYTKFVFNVATGNTMRQTSAATQATSSDAFRGINSAVLLSFKQTDDNKHISAATNADKRYDLQSIMSAGSIDETNSHRVIETSLPLNTNSMIFYGKAIQSSPADYEAYGHLDDFTIANPAATGLDMSATNIELGSRINGNLENFQKIETLIAGILTCIMNSNLNGSHKTAVTFQGNTVDYPDGIYWDGITLTAAEIQSVEPNVRVDIAEDTSLSKMASQQELTNLFNNGKLTFKEYVEAYPEHSSIPKDVLRKIVADREQKMAMGQPIVDEATGMPVDIGLAGGVNTGGESGGSYQALQSQLSQDTLVR
jgi:hypothetical protein